MWDCSVSQSCCFAVGETLHGAAGSVFGGLVSPSTEISQSLFYGIHARPLMCVKSSLYDLNI